MENGDSKILAAQKLRGAAHCAKETIPSLIAHKLRLEANGALISALNLGADPGRVDPAEAIAEAVGRSQQKIADLVASKLSSAALETWRAEYDTSYQRALDDGSWTTTFRGRDVISRFAGIYARGMKYAYFRDLIITLMSEAKYQPPGMLSVTARILAD